ncbi:MAG: hypothetical protein Unbinned6486contig1001_35 [Prokaryotic dsDNA virus sp.]|nr:MAG: hypothetical protein Unbinned6486contig1001_35 [Prokaryotic dsDNA virus sp.]|tara:strand:+ start:8686 stop:8895 length:210 start_codon:yes stop_codon:yes gene_type:complete
MIKFSAHTPQEKWIKKHYDSKEELIIATGLSRPTIDKLCKDINLFYKYVPLFSKVTKLSKQSIIRNVSK